MGGTAMSRIHFHDLKVTTVKSSSGVFSGQNYHHGWRSSSKTSDGNGTVTGNQNQFTEGHYAVFHENQRKDSEHEQDENTEGKG